MANMFKYDDKSLLSIEPDLVTLEVERPRNKENEVLVEPKIEKEKVV